VKAGLLSTTEAAKALGIAPRSLSRWAKDGVVTPALVTAGGSQRSGRYWWNLADLRAQLRGVRTRPEARPDSGDRPTTQM
jgi:predicted site-specific integrase-resolvase